MKRKMNTFIKQMVMYGIIGGFSAALDALIFKLLLDHTNINEYILNIISIHAGIFTSFILNTRFNFKATDRIGVRFLSFYTIGVSGLLLSEGLLYVGQHMGMQVFSVKLASIIIVALYQFLLNKFITFRTKYTNLEANINE